MVLKDDKSPTYNPILERNTEATTFVDRKMAVGTMYAGTADTDTVIEGDALLVTDCELEYDVDSVPLNDDDGDTDVVAEGLSETVAVDEVVGLIVVELVALGAFVRKLEVFVCDIDGEKVCVCDTGAEKEVELVRLTRVTVFANVGDIDSVGVIVGERLIDVGGEILSESVGVGVSEGVSVSLGEGESDRDGVSLT